MLSSVPTAMSRKQNTAALIFKLTPDILHEIFKLCALWVLERETYWPHLHSQKNPRPYNPSQWWLAWMKVRRLWRTQASRPSKWWWLAWTQVCRMWRTQALATPQLWQHIDMTDPVVASLAVARAGTLPLDILAKLPIEYVMPIVGGRYVHVSHEVTLLLDIFAKMAGGKRKYMSWVEWLASTAPRIKSLRLEHVNNELILAISKCITVLPAAVDVSLTLMRSEDSPALFHVSVPALRRLMLRGGRPEDSPALFNVSVPALRRLTLRGANPDWNTLRCPHLSSIDISSIYLSRQRAPTAGQILSLLAASPALITVKLRTPIEPSAKELPGPVSLPCLEFLGLYYLDVRMDNNSAVPDILRQLLLPPSVKLDLVFRVSEPQHCVLPRNTHILAQGVRFEQDLLGIIPPCTDCAVGWHPHMYGNGNGFAVLCKDITVHIFNSFCSLVDITLLTVLEFEGRALIHLEEIAVLSTFLCNASCVQVIRLIDCFHDGSGLTQLLTLLSTEPKLLCPALHTLSFGAYLYWAPFYKHLQSVIECARARPSLHTVEFINCDGVEEPSKFQLLEPPLHSLQQLVKVRILNGPWAEWDEFLAALEACDNSDSNRGAAAERQMTWGEMGSDKFASWFSIV